MPKADGRTRTSKASGSKRVSSSTRDDESDSLIHDIPSDYELFDRATTPRDYIEEDESTFWEIKGIVSEEIDLSKRTIYQVDWSPWKNYDGTSTTWEIYLEGPNTIIPNWKGVQTRKRRQKALEGPAIDLEVLDSYMPHNIHTAENACAFLEKAKKWQSKPDDWNVRDVNTDDKSKNWNKLQAGRKRKRDESSGRSSPSSVIDEIIPDSDEYEDPSSVASTSGQSSNASEIIWDVESRWNDEAVNKRAAGIRIINKIDDVSPVGPDFIYLEASRNYAKGIRQPKPDFLPSCDCKDGCKDPLLCPCVAKSQCIDDNGKPSPAYDRKGLFLFNHTREVVECNQNCSCRNCNNNVSQRARKVPLEVFKARENGWGVQPSGFVPRGTVLGLFTGALMKRCDAATLGPGDRQFSFDLDTRDDDPEYQDARKYTIAAHASGNWSRFINHCCEPSAIVYSVVIDTSLRDNMPYLAFVACEDIPAGKEITIDYNPKGIITAMEKKKGKGKGKMKLSGMPCVCESEVCRGFI